jgi:hypothetical protein
MLRYLDGERSIVRMQQSRERAQLVRAGAGLTGVPADGGAVRCSERAAELVLRHSEDAPGVSQDEVNRSRRGSGHWFRQSGQQARYWQASLDVVGTFEGRANEPLGDEGTPGDHEGTSVAVMGICKRLVGTCHDEATPRYALRGTWVVVSGTFMERIGTWLGVGGTSVHARRAVHARRGAGLAPWHAFQGVRSAAVDEQSAVIDEPRASVDEPPASVDEPPASVDEPIASVDEPIASVDEPPASVDEPIASVNEPRASVDELGASVVDGCELLAREENWFVVHAAPHFASCPCNAVWAVTLQ